MNIINTDLDIQKINNPYDIWVIDNFLKEDVLENIIQTWPSYEDENWYTGHAMIGGKKNILEQGMKGISKIENMPQYTKEVVQYLHSEDFTSKIEKLLGVSGLVPDKAMRWSGMRSMPSGSYQLIHSDARKSPETGLRKEITCLLYLNKGYDKQTNEGCLEIWNNDMTIRTHEIEPTCNRLVAFLNSDTSYHGVPLVKADRKFITFSILKQGSTAERSKALFVARPTDSSEVRVEGIKRSQVGDIG